jgi:transcriptional regulator with XRE-family HTH domain
MSGQQKKQDPIVERFAARLREVRQGRGMTQQQLADAAEVSVAFVGRLERGQAGPGIDIVAKLAAALATTPGDLLPVAEQPDAAALLGEQARQLIEALIATKDEVSLGLAVQLLSRLGQTASSDD